MLVFRTLFGEPPSAGSEEESLGGVVCKGRLRRLLLGLRSGGFGGGTVSSDGDARCVRTLERGCVAGLQNTTQIVLDGDDWETILLPSSP